MTQSGVGAEGNPLETTVTNFEGVSGSGGLFINNNGSLTIGGVSALEGISGSGGPISITANSPLTVSETVTNSGDIELTAADSGGADDLTLNARVLTTAEGGISLNAGRDIVVNDVGSDPEVFAHGNGPIVFRAGGDVLIDDDVSMGSEFGNFVTFPQVEEGVTLFVEPVDRGGSNVDSQGRATIRVVVGLVEESNYRLVVDWNDGTVDDYPFLDSGGASGEATVNRIPGGVEVLLSHRYNGSPQPNPSDPIPVSVTVGLDAQLTDSGQSINGIQFFTNGDFTNEIVTTVSRLQTVPGEGIQSYIPPVVHELDAIEPRAKSASLITNESSSEASADSESFEFQGGELETQKIGAIRLFFRVVDDVEKKELSKEYDLPFDSLDDLVEKFIALKLRNGHYRIYLDDPATGKTRLVLDLHLFNGNVVPPNFQNDVGERLPGDDGAFLLPADVDQDLANLEHDQLNSAKSATNTNDNESLLETLPVSATNDAEPASELPAADVGERAGENDAAFSSRIENQDGTAWKRRTRAAVVAAGAATLAMGAKWKDNIEKIGEDDRDLSKQARRRRRLK